MIKFNIITIFPEIFSSYFNESIIKRAQKTGKIKINIVDLRKFSTDKHRTVDEKQYGGGPGMVFKIEPLARAVNKLLVDKFESLKKLKNLKTSKLKTKIILFSPAGKQFDSKMAKNFAQKYDHIIMIAGHYEGVDARVKKVIQASGFKFQEISIGPYVLTGGELPAMVVVDAVSRHIPGVLGKNESLEEKRLGIGVPVYTRPEIFKWKNKKYQVPKVLLSGNHKKIKEWRKKYQKS